jgi:hypothetical protein
MTDEPEETCQLCDGLKTVFDLTTKQDTACPLCTPQP